MPMLLPPHQLLSHLIYGRRRRRRGEGLVWKALKSEQAVSVKELSHTTQNRVKILLAAQDPFQHDEIFQVHFLQFILFLYGTTRR